MGARERRRGAQAERELAGILSDALGRDIKRNLGQERDSGADLTIQHFVIEAKRCERLQIAEWCRQVEKAAKGGDVPVVAFRQDGQPWRVVMRLEDVIPMMRDQL